MLKNLNVHSAYLSGVVSVTAPIEKKMFGQEQPRYLEEEGFYVGVRPLVPKGNLHKMENRLLEEVDEGVEVGINCYTPANGSPFRHLSVICPSLLGHAAV